MAQNITLLGASYTDVPGVQLPKTGGGTALFSDASVTTATAADVAQGKIFLAADGTPTSGTASGGGGAVIEALSVTANGTYTAPSGVDGYSPVTVNVSGGGGATVEQKDVNFYDYDGTLLYSYTAAEALSLSELPENPTHSGLTAQGWNYNLAEIQDEVTVQGKCDIGQIYCTDDGNTRIYVHLEEGRLDPYFQLCPKGTLTIDWGDGSATSTLTGTSTAILQSVQHIFPKAGDYKITVSKAEGTTFGIIGTNNGSSLLCKAAGSSTANVSRGFINGIRKVELGSGVVLNSYAFSYCECLEAVNIPGDVTTIKKYAFSSCTILKAIIYPKNSSTAVPDNFTWNSYGVHKVVLPHGITSIGTYAFYGNRALYTLILPHGITSIGQSAFYQCMALTILRIPSGVATIPASCFAYCYGMKAYHFTRETPPALSNTNAFNTIASDTVIYVPSGSLTAYQEANRWSTYASYMQEET